jgi:hypothetical protein
MHLLPVVLPGRPRHPREAPVSRPLIAPPLDTIPGSASKVTIHGCLCASSLGVLPPCNSGMQAREAWSAITTEAPTNGHHAQPERGGGEAVIRKLTVVWLIAVSPREHDALTHQDAFSIEPYTRARAYGPSFSKCVRVRRGTT